MERPVRAPDGHRHRPHPGGGGRRPADAVLQRRGGEAGASERLARTTDAIRAKYGQGAIGMASEPRDAARGGAPPLRGEARGGLTPSSPGPGLSGRGGAYSGHEVKLHACFFPHFFALVVENPALTVSVLLTLAVLVVNGWTDAPQRHRRGGGHRGPALSGGRWPWRRYAIFWGCCALRLRTPSVVETIYSIAAFGGGPGAASLAPVRRHGSGSPVGGSGLVVGIPPPVRATPWWQDCRGAAVALEGSLACIRWQRWGGCCWG